MENQVFDLDRLMAERKEIPMKPDKLTWHTEPSGGDLKHVLTIKVSMDTMQRAQLEEMVCKYWDFNLNLTGVIKPEQGELFETEGFEDESNKELED